MRLSYRVEDDYLVKETEVQANGNYSVYKTEVVITKDAFIECYNKWIKQEV